MAYDHLFKFLMFGSEGSGKSSLILQYTDNAFSTPYVPTIGIDFKIKNLNTSGKNVELRLWDTPGIERFRRIHKIITNCQDFHAMMYVFDVTDAASFQNIKSWLYRGSEDVHRILIGNKCDLISNRVVTYVEASGFAKSFGMQYFETSAKNSGTIIHAFYSVTSELMKTRCSR